jgi:hypothetical protein
MRYQVLKIAVGVFLGILAALGVYKLIEVWQNRALTEQLLEQEGVDARKRQSRISSAADQVILMNPEKLIAICGPPLRDHFVGQSGRRLLTYTGADGQRINMKFDCIPSFCNFTGMEPADTTAYDSNYRKGYETYVASNGQFREPHVKEIEELPCLIGLSDLKNRE